MSRRAAPQREHGADQAPMMMVDHDNAGDAGDKVMTSSSSSSKTIARRISSFEEPMTTNRRSAKRKAESLEEDDATIGREQQPEHSRTKRARVVSCKGLSDLASAPELSDRLLNLDEQQRQQQQQLSESPQEKPFSSGQKLDHHHHDDDDDDGHKHAPTTLPTKTTKSNLIRRPEPQRLVSFRQEEVEQARLAPKLELLDNSNSEANSESDDDNLAAETLRDSQPQQQPESQSDAMAATTEEESDKVQATATRAPGKLLCVASKCVRVMLAVPVVLLLSLFLHKVSAMIWNNGIFSKSEGGGGFQDNKHMVWMVLLAAAQLDGLVAVILSRQQKNGQSSLQRSNEDQRPHLIFPGGGIYFYWQAGFVTYLRENGYDLGQVTLSGASCGALMATMTATNVDLYEATRYALNMVESRGLWDRPSGLYGIWGPMVQEWLEALLPENAVQLAHEHDLSLVITQMPWFKKEQIASFQSRHDLIACNQTSVHIPWFMNGNATISFRNETYVDGFLPPSIASLQPQPVQHEQSASASAPSRPTILVHWRQDPANRFVTPLHTVFMMSPSGIWKLFDQGKEYAKKMEEKGMLEVIPKVKANFNDSSGSDEEETLSEQGQNPSSMPSGPCR